ncbi:hypothetical protein YTPLAS73_05090 [Nitrosarchaeum sp.]|nr:hypothetical protein YTPLAS73_05090 [Nitrosarchaeum sp.]
MTFEEITPEFIDENQKLCQTIPKNSGPYPTQAKKSRRDKVLKLHFEYGYSARRISELMKINRNTINSDVNYWYSKLEKEQETVSADACLAKLTNRLESQRVQLREDLDKSSSPQKKMLLHKMLLEIDGRLIQFYMKMKSTDNVIYDLATKRLNEWMKEKKYDKQCMTMGSLCSFSFSTFDKITKIIKDDKVQTKYN